jgi:hypothetical protein
MRLVNRRMLARHTPVRWPTRPNWWVVTRAGAVLYRGARAADALRHVGKGDVTTVVTLNSRQVWPPEDQLPLD